jgi:hypothetical protein
MSKYDNNILDTLIIWRLRPSPVYLEDRVLVIHTLDLSLCNDYVQYTGCLTL